MYNLSFHTSALPNKVNKNMKTQKFIYKVIQGVQELETALNSINTNLLVANVIELDAYQCFIIVWEE